MRTRKAVISVALAGAALAATAASPALAASSYTGQNVGGGLVTRQSLTMGESIHVLGYVNNSGSRKQARISNYRVTGEYRSGEAWYVTLSPRLSMAPAGYSERVIFTSSN